MSFFMRNESLSSGFIQPSRIKLIPRHCQDGPSIVCGYGRAGRSMNILENKPFSHCSIHNNHNNCLPYGGLSRWKFIRDGVRVGVSLLQLIPLAAFSRHFVIFAFRLGPGHRQSHYPPALNAACCCRSQQGTMMEA